MNFELFISRRLIKGQPHKSSVSAPIIKIAIAAIAIGMVMMLIAMATGFGLKTKIREKISVFNGHLQIVNFDENQSNVSLKPISLQQDFYPEFKSVSGVEHIQAVILKAGVIRTEETFEGIIAKGVGTDYRWDVFNEFLINGRLPNFKEELNDEVIVSSLLANKLKLNIGDRVPTFFIRNEALHQTPNQRNFKVVGIFDSGFEEFDESYVFLDIRHLQRINRWQPNEVGHFEVFIDNFDAIETYEDAIYSATSSLLDVRSIKQRYYTLFEWIGLFDFNIALIIGIMILVGGINIITALLVLVLERINMIGILKAMGATNWSIRKLFIYKATYLILLGLFWGNAIGLTLLWLQQKYQWIKFPNPKEYYIRYVPVEFDLTSILLLNIGVLIVCSLMLLIPSYTVSKISPVKAIKFD